MAARNSGALIGYKKFANAVKRRQINAYCRGATLLVDLGCGRGGDLQKWQEAGVASVLALDLSAAQVALGARSQTLRLTLTVTLTLALTLTLTLAL